MDTPSINLEGHPWATLAHAREGELPPLEMISFLGPTTFRPAILHPPTLARQNHVEGHHLTNLAGLLLGLHDSNIYHPTVTLHC
jgi:hypothetical protein